MERLWQDTRIAARRLARQPGFTAMAVITLALGLGVNTAIFSLVDAVLLRPLPFADQDRLVSIYETRNGSGQHTVSAHEFIAWREATHVLSGATMFRGAALTLTGRADAVRVRASLATANVFDVFGVRPALGRGFLEGEDSGDARVVVLSWTFWRNRLGGDSTIIGKELTLDYENYQVVGVMVSSGEFDPDIWMPMDVPAEVPTVGRHALSVVARLRPGVTIERAATELNAISARLEEDLPQFNTGHRVRLLSSYEDVVGHARRSVLIVLGAVGCVLLIACANVAHLLLARAAGRRREIAICRAVGASRTHVVQQLILESIMLALAGGALGVLLAVWLVSLAPSIDAVQIPRLAEARVNTVAVMTTFTVALATGIASGLVPATLLSRVSFTEVLKDGTRGSGRSGRRIAGGLVVSELAVALMLLVGAGLLLESFARLTRVDPGFETDGVLVMPTNLSGPRYASPAAQRDAFEEIGRRLAALPGVTDVGGTTETPIAMCCSGIMIALEGQPPQPPGQEHTAMYHVTTGDYFRALGIPLRSGRFFDAADARLALPLIRWWDQQPYPARFDEPQAGPVAIINETMARLHWPDGNALGRRFRMIASPWITVVGVVGDVRHSGLGRDFEPEVFLPASQEPRAEMSMTVRFTGNRDATVTAARNALRAFDADLAIGPIRTMEQVASMSVASPRFNALALGGFAALAVLLALIGVYGVMSHSVAHRTREIGIRTALGATARDVTIMVLRQAGVLITLGIAIGLGGAFATTRLLTKLLFEVEPVDAGVFAALSLVLAGLSLLAGYVPARRALRIHPLVALGRE